MKNKADLVGRFTTDGLIDYLPAEFIIGCSIIKNYLNDPILSHPRIVVNEHSIAT